MFIQIIIYALLCGVICDVRSVYGGRFMTFDFDAEMQKIIDAQKEEKPPDIPVGQLERGSNVTEIRLGDGTIGYPAVTMEFDKQPAEFFFALYGHNPPTGYINICKIREKRNGVITYSYETTKIKEIEKKVFELRDLTNVYFEVCISPVKGRGNSISKTAMCGVWFDMDVAGPGHASKDYPQSQKEALAFALELKPTLVIDTGGGYHIYHLFWEPWIFGDETDRKKAQKVSQCAQQYILSKAKERGWKKQDNTSDLARLMRVPGTYNHKTGIKREVNIVFYDPNVRYAPEDFEPPVEVQEPQIVHSVQPQNYPDVQQQEVSTSLVVQYPPSNAANIKEHCGFFNRSVEDAASLTEPEWFALMSIVAHCENGAELCHKYSSPYPRYSVAETDKKIANVLKVPPHTCDTIRMNANADKYCNNCPFRGHIKSPISLGNSTKKAQNILSGVKILVESVKDPGAPFEAENLITLATLKREQIDSYSRIRSEMAKMGISVKSLEVSMQNLTLDVVEVGGTHYEVVNHSTYYYKPTQHGLKQVLLANFTAKISEQIIQDDGANRSIVLKISGNMSNGNHLPDIVIPSAVFRSMLWVLEYYGPEAIIQPGQSTADHLRTAIQINSNDILKRTIYTHTGWREIRHEWRFLTATGALGKDGLAEDVEIQLEGKLRHYAFPKSLLNHPPIEAVTASFELLKVAPYRVTIPLLCAIYRAPLEEVISCHMTVFIAGQTGTFKSELTGLALSHFGPDFNGKNLTAEWTSTANALEKIAFLVKDTICVIDDYYPGTSQNEAAKMNATANRVIRGKGNDSGRARMKADGGLQVTFTPRSLILTTGEDIPKGPSLRARMYPIEVSKGDVDTTVLTKLQQHGADGMLAAAMVGYLRWLAPQIDDLKKTSKSRRSAIRDEIIKDATAHTRTPDVIADLLFGLEFFLKYALEIGACSEQQAFELWDEAEATLIASNESMKEMLEADDPVQRFCDLLMSVFVSGVGHIVSTNGGEPPHSERWGWKPVITANGTEDKGSGKTIGWIEGPNLYLDMDSALAAVQEIASKQGSPITITPGTLRKRLHEKGLLVKDSNTNKLLKSKNIGGVRQKVMHLLTTKMLGDTVAPDKVINSTPSPFLTNQNPATVEENPFLSNQNPFEDDLKTLADNSCGIKLSDIIKT